MDKIRINGFEGANARAPASAPPEPTAPPTVSNPGGSGVNPRSEKRARHVYLKILPQSRTGGPSRGASGPARARAPRMLASVPDEYASTSAEDRPPSATHISPVDLNIPARLHRVRHLLDGSTQIYTPAEEVFGVEMLQKLKESANEGPPVVLDEGGITAKFDRETSTIGVTTGIGVIYNRIQIQLDPELNKVETIRFDPPVSHFEMNYLVEFGLLSREFESQLGLTPLPIQSPPTFPELTIDRANGQELVDQVAKWVRKVFYSTEASDRVKSSNKWHANEGANQFARRRIACKLRLEFDTKRLAFESVDAAASVVRNSRVQNCGELSAVSAHYLGKLGLDACMVKFGEVHAACLVRTQGKKIVHWDLMKPMYEWPDDLFICDVWANVACRAKDFPVEFTSKMKKWQKDSKLIAVPAVGRWVSAGDPAWVKRVLSGCIAVSV